MENREMDSFSHHQHEELQIKDEPIDQFSVLPSTEKTNMQHKYLHIKSESSDQGFKCEKVLYQSNSKGLVQLGNKLNIFV